MTTILLHGFWGAPRDWAAVLTKLPLGAEVLAVDLYEDGPLGPRPLETWCQDFWSWVDHQHISGPLQLVGYSMGGRLALKALLKNPSRVARALLLSAHVIFPAGEAAARERWELDWAAAFQKKPWSELESTWQEQPVFSQSQGSARRHEEELRLRLARSLVDWSPRYQNISTTELRGLGKNVTFAFGALDQKYVGMAKTLQDLPVRGQIILCPEAGHRLILEAADFVAQWIENRGGTPT